MAMETHIQDFANGSNFSSSWELQVRDEKDAEANIESLMADKRLFVKWRLGFQVAWNREYGYGENSNQETSAGATGKPL